MSWHRGDEVAFIRNSVGVVGRIADLVDGKAIVAVPEDIDVPAKIWMFEFQGTPNVTELGLKFVSVPIQRLRAVPSDKGIADSLAPKWLILPPLSFKAVQKLYINQDEEVSESGAEELQAPVGGSAASSASPLATGDVAEFISLGKTLMARISALEQSSGATVGTTQSVSGKGALQPDKAARSFQTLTPLTEKFVPESFSPVEPRPSAARAQDPLVMASSSQFGSEPLHQGRSLSTSRQVQPSTFSGTPHLSANRGLWTGQGLSLIHI